MTTEPFSDIYRAYRPKILAYLNRLVGSFEAEDLTQTVFTRVNDKLASFESRSSLSTWIFKIATNAAMDRFRSKGYTHSAAGSKPPLPLEEIDTSADTALVHVRPTMPEQETIRREMQQCIREYVDRLTPEYRTVIILNELEGFSAAELAEVLGIGKANAKMRLHRARAALRKLLEAGCTLYVNERNVLSCDRKQ